MSRFGFGCLACLILLAAGCSGLRSGDRGCVCESKLAEAGAPGPTPVAALQPAGWDDLPGWQEDNMAEAWPAFLRSCKVFRSRRDWRDWQTTCEIAEAMVNPDTPTIRMFWESYLAPWSLSQTDGDREGLITGYYEPILKGDDQPTRLARFPILAVPDDLLVIDMGDLYPELKSYRLRGRIDGRRVVPYDARSVLRQHEGQRLSSNWGGAIAWVEDLVELFFLHIQGSGRILLPDGRVIRVGYADQNGHPYKSVGKVLIERGELKVENASMQGIQAWAKANPEKIEEVLNANPSYVFFRRLPDNGNGPIGALGVPLEAQRSLAIDPRVIPLGAPVFVATTQPLSAQPLNRVMLAQDTGGAIKGPVRADFFWGLGLEAGKNAGRMKQKARMWVLLPIVQAAEKRTSSEVAPK